MFWYRITKYNPASRNELGHYLKDEWTDFCDIGQTFEGKVFTYKEYLLVEDKYIRMIEKIMDVNNVDFFKIDGLECYGYCKSDGTINRVKLTELCFASKDLCDKYDVESILFSLKNEVKIFKKDIDIIARLLIRGFFWCKLVNENMKFDFGYEFYMYIGSTTELEARFDELSEDGMYIENITSCYVDE